MRSLSQRPATSATGLIELCRSRLAPLPSPTTEAKAVPGWFGAEDQGADVAAADINGSGWPDLLVFHVDNPGGENHGYYRIGWDMSPSGDVSGWSSLMPVPGWFGAEDQGAGVALGDVNGGGRSDLVVFHLDNPGGENHGHYRIGWNLDVAGNIGAWSDVKAIPGWFGWENQGGGIALYDINGSGRPDLVVFHVDNPGGENHGYYRIGWNLDTAGNVASWSDVKAIPGWFGTDTQGAGIAVADLNSDQRPELVVFHVDNPTGENRGYYRIGWNLDTEGNVGPRWGPLTPVTGWFGAENQGAGATVVDVSGNGLACSTSTTPVARTTATTGSASTSSDGACAEAAGAGLRRAPPRPPNSTYRCRQTMGVPNVVGTTDASEPPAL